MAWEFPGYPDNWDEIRHIVYKRDNYTCQECGAKGKRVGGEAEINCHHIVSLSKNGTNDYSNLITLCDDCHTKKHPHLQLQRDGLTKIVRKLARG
jgi:5-methylcytosine-specific restriction endonuclease McrA